MTVSNTTAGVVRIGNGVTQEFDFTFEVQSAAHVVVAQILGVAVIDLDPSQYSVALVGAGGTVTLTFIPAVDYQLYIYRRTPREQLVSVSSQNRYDPTVIEAVWDKLTFVSQEIQAELDRAVKTVPGGDPDALLTSIETSVSEAAVSQAAAAGSASAAASSANDAAASAAAAATFVPANYVNVADPQTITGAKTLAAQLSFADALINDVALIGTTDQSRLLNFSGGRAKVGKSGVYAMLMGGTGLGVVLTVNANLNALTFDSLAQVDGASLATQAEAEAGVISNKLMTPARVKQAITAQRPAPVMISGSINGLSTFEVNSIPAGVEWVEGAFDNLSLNGTNEFLVQLGHAGSWLTTGYSGGAFIDPATTSVASTAGFMLKISQAVRAISGLFRLRRVSANIWAFSSTYSANEPGSSGGSINVTADLTRVRLFPSGANLFDNGTLMVQYGY